MNAAVNDQWLSGLREYEAPETEADRANAAHQQVVPGVSTGALLQAMEEPEMFQELARADLYTQMAHMRRQMADPRITPAQRIDYIKQLAKMGKVENPEVETAGTGNLPTINISFPNSGQSVNISATQHSVEKDVTPINDL